MYLSFYLIKGQVLLFIEYDKKSVTYHNDNEIHESKVVY